MTFCGQSLMLSITKGLLEEEEREREVEKRRYMAEACRKVSMPRTVQELQVVSCPCQRNQRAAEATYSVFVFRGAVRRFTARLTRLMRKDTTFRRRSPSQTKEARKYGRGCQHL